MLNQDFIKKDKKTVRQYLDGIEKYLTINMFKRVQNGG
jgi:translation elongation factor EF-Ts